MNENKRRELELKGWKITNAEQFLDYIWGTMEEPAKTEELDEEVGNDPSER